MKPVIAITAGDISGIGPEVIVKSLDLNPGLFKKADFLLIGSKSVVLANFKKYTQIKPNEINIINNISRLTRGINILDCPEFEVSSANINSKSGILSYKFVETAVELALAKKVSAVVTAPINKSSWQRAGIKFPGHTEALARLSHSANYAMAFYSKKLKIILETIHCPLSEVAKKISIDSIYNKIMLADGFLKQLGTKFPRIAVAGLNPHAGESGILGREEIEIIQPAVIQAKKKGIQVEGPYPADTIFYKAVVEKQFDMVVAMYHDQGLAPLKMMAFHDAVNITLGLPFIRTSPDHGTAPDIAGKGIANPSSMTEAIKLGIRLVVRDKC